MSSAALRAAPFAAALLLAGCGGGGPRSAGSAPPAKPGATAYRWLGREQVGKAIALLDQGKAKPARKLLAGVLARDPGDAIAARLIKQIDSDPRQLLGAESFPYVTRPNEGFATIAQRFLGDPQMFYALARYNDVAVPASLAPGTMLRIPGHEKRAAPPPPTPPPPRAQPAPHPVAEPPPPRPAPAAVRPTAPAADPGKAAQLRTAGLEQMNRGAISRAVVLLQQASRLDPASVLIRRDLERAIRIRRTVLKGR